MRDSRLSVWKTSLWRAFILLAEVTARVITAHISSKHSVAMVAFAKSKGLTVTAETTPHHFAITDADMLPYDSN